MMIPALYISKNLPVFKKKRIWPNGLARFLAFARI